MNPLPLFLPLLGGFLLDALLGDPYTLPHPVRLMGAAIARLEKFLRPRLPGREGLAGTLLALCVLLLSTALPAALLLVAYRLHLWLGIVVESILCYYMLAAHCLQKESMKVCRAMEQGDVEAARQAVSMIVGRDTQPLDGPGIIRAAVETVAENTSDGVTAPLFYMALGGAIGGFFYKAANTMDSMLGYKNEKYRHFGRFAARLDDLLNYLPSRLTALLMVPAAFLLGLDAKGAFRIWRRDRHNHASPNSAQTEAACAGALGLMLAGDAWYFGQLHQKPTIGDNTRPIQPQDIRRANRLMYTASLLMLVLALAARTLFWLFAC